MNAEFTEVPVKVRRTFRPGQNFSLRTKDGNFLYDRRGHANDVPKPIKNAFVEDYLDGFRPELTITGLKSGYERIVHPNDEMSSNERNFARYVLNNVNRERFVAGIASGISLCILGGFISLAIIDLESKRLMSLVVIPGVGALTAVSFGVYARMRDVCNNLVDEVYNRITRTIHPGRGSTP